MQSTTNYLWLISDLLGQGATANVYRGRHKVGSTCSLHRPGHMTQGEILIGVRHHLLDRSGKGVKTEVGQTERVWTRPAEGQ